MSPPKQPKQPNQAQSASANQARPATPVTPELTEVLTTIMRQLSESQQLTQRLLEENNRLRESATSEETPRMRAGGSPYTNNVKLMSDLSRRLPKYAYSINEFDSFKKWIARHELIFREDGAALSERERTRLLLGCLEENTFQRFLDSQRDVEDIYDVTFEDTVKALLKVFGSQRSIMIRRQACLQISRSSGRFEDPLEYTNFIGESVTDAQLSKMTSDDWSVFIFLRGLDSPADATAKQYLMQYCESAEKKGESITLSNLHDEWIRFQQMKKQTKVVSASKNHTPIEVNKLDTKESKNREGYRQKSEKPLDEKKPPVCYKCKKVGHLAPKCPTGFPKKKGHHEVKQSNCIRVSGIDISRPSKRSMSIPVNGVSLTFDLDTGSMITLVSSDCWNRLGRPTLEEVDHGITCANGSPLKVLGRVKVRFSLKNVQYEEYLYVRKDFGSNLIGMSWINHSPEMREVLDLMVNKVETPSSECSRLEQLLVQQFPGVFSDGLGLCVKEKAQLRTANTIKPVFKRARPVPYGSREAVETELQRLVDMGVIEKVSHAKWASPIVVIRKKDTGKIRACGGFKSSGLNNALLDEYHPLPTIEDIFGQLKGSIFTQIDFRDAYLQVELDEESQQLVVINTHKGLYKYKRMAFGIKSAPAIFQKIVDKMIAGLPGVAAYLDDVIVSSNSYEEHESVLKQLFQRIQEYGFRVSPDKCAFAKKQISFLGFIVDKNGRRPDPAKTEVIRTMQAPKDQKQLSSFLGAICFYSRFVDKLSTLRAPLDQLMKKDMPWRWTSVEQEAFEKLKTAVADSTLLSHFQESWPINVAADASAYGIGGVLTHINPDGIEVPVAHFARSLTETEKKYSQIEKEGLALVYTIQKCHKFIFGRKFHLQTDHRPLLAIFGSSKDLPVHSQNRLVRWAMTLMSYDFDVSYISTNKFAKADWLSRVIQKFPQDKDDVVIAEVADDEWRSDSLTPVLESDIAKESAKDSELLQVFDWVNQNSWKVKPTSDLEKAWSRVKDRLKIINHCLMLDERVIVPKTLQSSVLKQLHEGHPGVVRMKQKARSFVYWKGLDSEIENHVKFCDHCQEHSKMPRVTPLKPWPVPEKPWTRIHIDFAGPLDGVWFLVVVDALTKYAEVKLTRKISAVATVDLLEEIFATHGFPEVIVSDNGTQLTSQLFKKMCQSHGIEHMKTATYYPRSNGAAERFVDTLKRGIAKIRGTGSITQQVLNSFLLNYRNTPHASLDGLTPAEKHFGRKIRTVMSLLMPSKQSDKSKELSKYQLKMKTNYDAKNAARAKSFQINQSVYVRVQSGNNWSWEYGKVRSRIGKVLYEVQVGERIHRSHVNQLRQRYGDQSPEELFIDTVFPQFFDFQPALHANEPRANFSRGAPGVDNPLNVTDSSVTQGFEARSPLFFPPPASSPPSFVYESESSDGRCGSMDKKKDQSEHGSKTRDTQRNVKTCPQNQSMLPLDRTSSSHLPTSSHSLRRSNRIRRAPKRYDPCMENPSVSTGSAQRGSNSSTGQAPTRTRGIYRSGRRTIPGQDQTNSNFSKGEVLWRPEVVHVGNNVLRHVGRSTLY